MVMVACTGAPPGVTDLGAMEQPMPALEGAVQLKATAALNPSCGVTVMVDEAELPGFTGEGVAAPSVNPGGATLIGAWKVTACINQGLLSTVAEGSMPVTPPPLIWCSALLPLALIRTVVNPLPAPVTALPTMAAAMMRLLVKVVVTCPLSDGAGPGFEVGRGWVGVKWTGGIQATVLQDANVWGSGRPVEGNGDAGVAFDVLGVPDGLAQAISRIRGYSDGLRIGIASVIGDPADCGRGVAPTDDDYFQVPGRGRVSQRDVYGTLGLRAERLFSALDEVDWTVADRIGVAAGSCSAAAVGIGDNHIRGANVPCWRVASDGCRVHNIEIAHRFSTDDYFCAGLETVTTDGDRRIAVGHTRGRCDGTDARRDCVVGESRDKESIFPIHVLNSDVLWPGIIGRHVAVQRSS